ncbi:GGDEF domain-containing protein [Acidovorax sp.]|uniref:GGDEF domain-containing protein n=1 Tax=Acidovorax sp. TaxID=1872122 RepID=UPI0025C5E827|nr:GGDEF domain-containing protein [Acidovorax sp.]
MTNLDPRSMIAMAGFMSAIMAVVLLFMRRHYPPSIRGVGAWAVAPLLWLVSTVLFSARGVIPSWLSLVLANQLLVLGALIYYMGTRHFMGHRFDWRFWGWIMAGSTMVFVVLTYWFPSYTLRVGFFTVLMGCIYVAQLRFMLRQGDRSFPVRLVQVVLAVHTLVLAVRLTSILIGKGGSDLMEPSLFQTLYIGAYVLMVLMLSIGAVLMATDRLRTELEHLATHDSLTNTLNRRALLARCEDELERAQRYGHGPSIMMVDLDNFKAVNDTRGHQHGDAVLVHFADCTRQVLRRADRLGRYGGEEFLVLLPDSDTDAAMVVAQRIHATLATGHALDCQVSIGLTSWTGSHDTLDAMLSRADAALYRAKREGRNRTVVASEPIQAPRAAQAGSAQTVACD